MFNKFKNVLKLNKKSKNSIFTTLLKSKKIIIM